jgi:hypothetical protein
MVSTTPNNMAKGLTLDQLKAMGATPSGGVTLAQLQQQAPQQQAPSDPLNGFATIASKLFGNQGLGSAIGSSIAGIGDTVGKLAHGDLAGAAAAATKGSKEVNSQFGRATGDVIKDVALPASLALGAPAAIGKAALQYGALGATSSAGESLSQGNNDAGTIATDAAKGGVENAFLGGAFNLLGKGISAVASKAGPSALAFTSGVPKAAIEQAAANPDIAKTGLKMSVDEVRHQAVGALQSLHNDLGSEFREGLTQVGTDAAPGAADLGQKLTSAAQSIAKEFKVATTPGASGLSADLSSSAIVKSGEVNSVKKALQTVSTWSDFSPQGMQTLSERLGALRNFESGATTKSSAIVGKLYSSVNDAIKETYPQLSQLRTNYATNRTVLDGIGNVLSADKSKPVQVQAAVSRLDNLFKDNKDEYVNAIRQLSQKSGVDFLSLLAGGEFQKVLPGFIRGLGGGGAVGVGASLINPYLLLLAPLFSPRVVGSIARNAPAAAKTASQLTRAATTQTIQREASTQASAPAK